MWKPSHFPYARVLIANPNLWERKFAREFLLMMKIHAIFEVEGGSELAEAFWNNDFQLVVLDCDFDGPAGLATAKMLRSAEALAPYVDRIMMTVPRANLRTIRLAQTLGIGCMVLKPWSIESFCSHAAHILERTMGVAQAAPEPGTRSKLRA